MLRYDTRGNVLTAGLNLRPADRLDVSFQANYADATAAMDPFDLSRPDFTARFPAMQWDFSQTPGYSDLDVRSVDAWLDARYRLTERAFVRGAYRYVDFDDQAPYLYDTTGRNHLVFLALGWTF